MPKKETNYTKLKTSELLDLLETLVDEDGNLLEGWEEVDEELKSRTPFFDLEELKEKVEDLEWDIKQLKKHSHQKNQVVVPLS